MCVSLMYCRVYTVKNTVCLATLSCYNHVWLCWPTLLLTTVDVYNMEANLASSPAAAAAVEAA